MLAILKRQTRIKIFPAPVGIEATKPRVDSTGIGFTVKTAGAIIPLPMIKRVTIRNILLISMLAIAGTLVFVVSDRFQLPTAEKVIDALPSNVDLALKKINYTETRGDDKLWSLTADSVDHVSGLKQTLVENVHMVFFSLGAFGDVTLTADKGQWFQQEGRIDLEGNVEAHSSTGASFFTDELTYLKEQGVIQTSLPVRMVDQKMELIGTGFHLDLNTHQLELFSHVRGKFHGW